MADAICVVKLLAASQRLIMELRDPSTGDIIATYGNVDMDLTDLIGSMKRMAFRETKGTDASGAPAYAYFLRTQSYGTRAEGSEPDFQGGGGGAVTQYRLKSVQGDYLTCRTWDGTTEGGTDVYIAKNMKLRNSITAATIDGVAVTYSYATTVARTATISSVDEDQVVVPRYLADDLIYAITVANTEVTVSSTELTLLDMNVDGRAWAKEA